MSDELDGLAARQEAERRQQFVAATTPLSADMNAASYSPWSAEFADEFGADPIPADRFVTINRNSPAFRQADEVLDRLAHAVRGSNDLFANADERLAVVREVEGVSKAIRAGVVRAAAVLSDNSVIAFLAKEGVSAVIRTLAVEALKWLWTLIRASM